MKKHRIADIMALLISLTPFVFWYFWQDALPDRIPVHWNIHGEADNWKSKSEIPGFLAMMGGLAFGIYLLLRFIRKIDPKRTAQMNEGVAVKIGLALAVFISAINIFVMVPDKGQLDVGTVVILMISMLFIFLGNVMYNIKPNYFIGIRVPWTLEDENNWRHTHRLAGVLWFIGGIIGVIIILLFKPRDVMPIFFGITMLMAFVPVIYSFIFFRKHRPRQNTNES